MKVAPTLDGRIRIDMESKLDWMILQSIAYDARAVGIDLADRLGDSLGDEASLKDWEDFVLPELRQDFSGQLAFIDKVLSALDAEAPEPVFICKEDAEIWYGGLNQARIALEERYHFIGENPDEMTPGKRTAWFRDGFYLDLQTQLLDYLMLG